MLRIAPLLAAPAIALASCGGGGAAESPTSADSSFDYATTREYPFQIEVLVEGTPAAFARVQLLAPLPPLTQNPEPNVGTELFATGLTDAGGHWQGTVTVPATCTAFDVLVQVPGASGLLEPAGYASLWGPFAPSARVRVDGASLLSTSVSLHKD